MDNLGQKTKAVRAGQVRTQEREHSDPIFATSSFVFDSAEQAALLFAETESGNIYSRFTNPTTRAFESRLASLENATFCTATASGMSAILSLCMTVLKSGDHIAATQGLFGSTVSLFNNILTRFNVETSYFSPQKISGQMSGICDNTKMIFVESPSNPMCEIVDFAKLIEIARSLKNCILVVDNCACTPVLQNPFDLGVDVVVHSSAKFLDGQGRAVGGAVATNNPELAKGVFGFLRTAGPTMSPFNAWIFHKGMETLPIRMKESSENASTIAHWLNGHSKVKKVHYPGLKNHNGYELAKLQQRGFGALLAFEVRGGKSTAWNLIDRIEIFSITGNFGDVKSSMTHPASTTHARVRESDRIKMGITDDLIRICVGLEDVDDLIADLETALNSI